MATALVLVHAAVAIGPVVAFGAGVRAAGADGAVLVVGDGSGYARQRSVRVRATIIDPDGAERAYQVAEADRFTGAWSPWGEGDQIDVVLELRGGDGRRQVELRYRSSTMQLELSGAVELDTSSPDVGVAVDRGAAVTRDRRLDLDIDAADASPISELAVSLDGGLTWRHVAPGDRHPSVTLPRETRAGSVRVLVRATDAAGNTGMGRARIRYRPASYTTMHLRLAYDLTADASYRTGLVRVDETVTITNPAGRVVTWVDLYLMPRAFGELRDGPRVTVDGVSVRARWINNANMRVDLPAPIGRGESTRVRLRFTVRASATIRSSLEARLARSRGLMTVGHWFATVGAGHAARYPGDALVSPVAERITLRLTHDPGAVVASPGSVESRAGRSVVIVHAPARDLAFALSPAYRVRVGHAGRVRIEVYARSSRLAAAALSTARAAVMRFSAILGPYPWPRLVIAESP